MAWKRRISPDAKTPMKGTFDMCDGAPDDLFNKRGFINEKGVPKLCRLEFKVTTLEEAKQCAVHISELNAKLQGLVYDTNKPDLLRILHTRAALAEAQFHLKYIPSRHFRQQRKIDVYTLGQRKKRGTTRSVVRETSDGVLDNEMADQATKHQPTESKGE